MPSQLVDEMRALNQLGQLSTQLLPNIVRENDVIYCTRVQKERFSDLELYERVKTSLTVDPNVMANAKSKMILMHPLPRNHEIPPDVDRDPRTTYFRQVNV